MGKGIERITLRRFRGATTSTELVFDQKKLVVMIFGENGSGKSSIIDAIDFIFNRTSGSLEGRSSTPGRHLPAIGHSASDMSVEITCAGETWSGVQSGREVRVSGSSSTPLAHVLRRRQLLKLTEAAPAERYEALRRFIDVAQVESCESTLNRAVREVNAQLSDAVNRKQDADEALTKLWETEGKPRGHSESPLAWAEQQADVDVAETSARATQLNGLIGLLEATQTARCTWTTAQEAVVACEAQVKTVEEEIAKTCQGGEANGTRLLKVLTEVKSFIAPLETPDLCPVCRRPIEASALRQDVDAQINALGEMMTLADRHDAAVTARTNAAAHADRCRIAWDGAARALAMEAHAICDAEPDLLAVDWKLFERLLSPDGADSMARLSQASVLVDLLAERRPRLESLISENQSEAVLHNAISQHYERVTETNATMVDIDAVHKRLQRALGIMREKRIDFTQDVLDRVAEECNQLYERIHPGEALGKSRLRLDEKQRASLHQVAHFQGHDDVPPQVYFSESHLDTLGFCLFLALAKEYRVDIIVLDDVFTSVDQPHLWRVMELLTELSEHFDQIIITTHYRQWRDRYKLLSASGSRIELLELAEWSIDCGIRVYQSKLAVDELQTCLGSLPFDRQSVASKAGILLEAVLDRLALLYRCRVPRVEGNDYTLGDLCSAVTKLGRILKVRRPSRNGDGKPKDPPEEEEVSVRATLEAISGMAFVRNQVGCHFNARGSDIDDGEVRRLGEETVNLVSTLACHSCGTLAERRKGTHFSCPCGMTRMEPLEFQS